MPGGPDLLEQIEFAPSGCWLWKGAKIGAGYGRAWAYGRYMRAHRFTYAAANGPIPDDHAVHHTCEEKTCVNPSHLRCLSNEEHGRHHYAIQEANGRPPYQFRRKAEAPVAAGAPSTPKPQEGTHEPA